MATFFGVSEPFISQIENGRAKLPERCIELLQNNGRGWVVSGENEVAEPSATYNNTAQNWPEIVADLAAKVGEQNQQIGRLLTIVEQLTAGKK